MAKSETKMLAYFRPRHVKGSQRMFMEFDAPVLLQKFLAANLGKKMYADMGRETGVRSLQQNAALHVGFGLIAEELNAAGLDMRQILKPEVQIPWTTSSVKEFLYRPLMKIMTGKESTRDLGKTDGDIDKVWDAMMHFLGENHGVEYVPFPSDQSRRGGDN